MNKMLNPNGGVFLKLTDLAYMQDAIRDAFKSVLNAFSNGSGNVRLAGCVVTRQDIGGEKEKVTWTSGWVALNGEVFTVSAGNIVSVDKGAALYWKITRVQEAVITLANGEQGARRERSYATLVTEGQKDDQSVADVSVKVLGDYMMEYAEKKKVVTSVETYIDGEKPGLVLPAIYLIDYPDGSDAVTLIGATTGEVTLSGGLLCKYRGGGNFDGVGTILDNSNNSIKVCSIIGNNSEVRVYQADGSPVTTLPQGVIKMVQRN